MSSRKQKKQKNQKNSSKKLDDVVDVDIDSMSDAMSDVTSFSTKFSDDVSEFKEIQNELGSLDLADDKIVEFVEGLTEKSSKYRLMCFTKIQKYFTIAMMTSSIDRYQETLLDGIEKSLKKGGSEEVAKAADTLSISLFQFQNGDDDVIDLYSRFQPLLTKLIKDTSMTSLARCRCCYALATITFITEDDVTSLLECMTSFESIFHASFYKGDGTSPNLKLETTRLHAVALLCFSLLLTVLPWQQIESLATTLLSRIPELLSSNDVTLRIRAGELLALFYEIARRSDHDELLNDHLDHDDVIIQLRALATDSAKYRAKRDRRHQRSNFRDILSTIEDDDVINTTLKLGCGQRFEIDSWSLKLQYDVIREVLNAGVTYHLRENQLLRDVFGLGRVLLGDVVNHDMTSRQRDRFERNLLNQANEKERSLARGKHRDKRVAEI